MPPFIASLLKEHLLKQKQQARWGGNKWQDTGYVFTSSKGTPFHASNVYRSFKALLRESKLPDIRFHDLRGSYASFLAHHNVPVPALMNAMGHTDAKTTLTHYADVLDESKVHVAQTVEAVLNGPVAS
jgi:integrase